MTIFIKTWEKNISTLWPYALPSFDCLYIKDEMTRRQSLEPICAIERNILDIRWSFVEMFRHLLRFRPGLIYTQTQKYAAILVYIGVIFDVSLVFFTSLNFIWHALQVWVSTCMSSTIVISGYIIYGIKGSLRLKNCFLVLWASQRRTE